MNQTEKKENKLFLIAISRPFIAACIIVGILFLLFMAPGLISALNGTGQQQEAEQARQWEFEEDQQSPVEDQDEADAMSISIPGFESATIAAGEETVTLHLYNPENNTCYFQITLFICDSDGTEQQIYQSKLLSPGTNLYEITLDESLPAGTYQAYLSYATYTMDGAYTPLNGANVPFTLYVE